MFCNNCGQPIDDDRDLCEQCEKAAANKAYNKSFTFDDQAEDIHVEETEEYGYDNEVPYADYELNDSAKHSKPNVARIIGIAAAICVVAVLIALFWRPLFGLFFPLLHFDTPQEHFAFLEKEDAKKFASFITASYEKTITGYEKKYPVNQYRAHILLGDQAQDLLGSYLFNDDANVDISWLSDILIDVDTTEDEGLSEAVVTVGLGEDKVLSADLIVDTSKYILWAAIPELSKHYLEFDLDTLFEEYYGQSVEESGLFADKNLQYLSALPSGQVVYQLAMKYLDIALGKITNVQSTEQTVTIGSMSRECTALTATIPEKTLIEIFICLMETLKEDEVILGAMQDLADLSGENPDKIKEDFIEQINTSIADLQNSLTEAKDTNYLQWTDYVENEINLIGRRVTISDSEQEFYYLKLKDQESFVYEAQLLDDLVISGGGKDMENTLNASYELKVEGNEYCTINLVDFDYSKFEYGHSYGKILLEPGPAMYEEILGINLGLDLVLEFLFDTTDQIMKFELNALLDNQMFVGITLDGMRTDGKAVTQPAKILDPNDDTQLARWLQSFDFDTLISNLKKTNMPGELINAIDEYCELIAQSLEGY